MADISERIGTATCFCGLCCSARQMCEHCMEATLRANGLEVNENNLNELRSIKDAGHGRYFGGATEYTWKIMTMVGKAKELWQQQNKT